MEEVSDVERFLNTNYDGGYGPGHASGEGFYQGFGDGNGFAEFINFPTGYCPDGCGCPIVSGSQKGLLSFNRQKVHYINGNPVVINEVYGNIAKGAIINNDLTTKECFIAKVKEVFILCDCFSALQALIWEKVNNYQFWHPFPVAPCFEGTDISFINSYKNDTKKYPNAWNGYKWKEINGKEK